ncbi:MAG: TldD/PmbA family protein, partial [Acidobacteria bacterium]|nr:TldD/PmbA family protein [Acidobacteriota bacterium]
MPAVALESKNKSETDLAQVAQDVVRRAMKAGATAAEAVVREGSEFSTVVRMREVESLKEAGAKSLGLRLFFDKRVASTHTSDLSEYGIQQMVDAAIALARITSEDPNAGLPDASELGAISGNLDLYHEDVYSLPNEKRIDYARRAEAAALDYDARIRNSEGGSFDAATGNKVLANSLGFVGEYRRSYCSVSAVPIAQDDSGMQRDYWYSITRSLSRLESPEHVGRVAAQRTLRRLGARKAKTAKVPIIFDPQVSRSFLDSVFEAANGDAIYRGASFLTGKLGERVAVENLNVIDDGTIPG